MRSWVVIILLGLELLGSEPLISAAEKQVVTVGSKSFTESYILAEITSEVIESTGEATVDRRFGMGATGILYTAVQTGAIDLYPEYSGTISEVILKDSSITKLDQIQKELLPKNLTVSKSLGFSNTYALGLRGEVANMHAIQTISDLSKAPHLRCGFSYEFMNRPDGYLALIREYGLHIQFVQSMEHSIAYEALAQGKIDCTDVYSTDAKIEKLRLTLLRDNKDFFPKYEAVLLVRSDFAQRFPRSWKALQERLENGITEKQMAHLNAEADLKKVSFRGIAEEYLRPQKTSINQQTHFQVLMADVLLRTRQHLLLVLVSLIAAISIGIPMGVLASRHKTLGHLILGASGLLQTIPSLALLCFLIPIFGVGTLPALVSLYLYALLPIVSNTFLGLTSIDSTVLDSAKALGLSPVERLRTIELPLASPSILSGIRTSGIISIGTATLAALIGAGGYGVPIVTGLALNDIPTILTGAIPAAVLALIAQLFFDQISRWIIPKGIQRSHSEGYRG